jgi:hypothetical protein
LLRQACAHCGKFLAAASRRSGDRVSVPLWLAVLSDQLPIIATVGHDPTVQLIGRRTLLRRVFEKTLSSDTPPASERMRNYPPFPRAIPHQRAGSPRVPHPSATGTAKTAPFDLHALGTPPALILSQDQTLHQGCLWLPHATPFHYRTTGIGSVSHLCAARTSIPLRPRLVSQDPSRTASPSSAHSCTRSAASTVCHLLKVL